MFKKIYLHNIEIVNLWAWHELMSFVVLNNNLNSCHNNSSSISLDVVKSSYDIYYIFSFILIRAWTLRMVWYQGTSIFWPNFLHPPCPLIYNQIGVSLSRIIPLCFIIHYSLPLPTLAFKSSNRPCLLTFTFSLSN